MLKGTSGCRLIFCLKHIYVEQVTHEFCSSNIHMSFCHLQVQSFYDIFEHIFDCSCAHKNIAYMKISRFFIIIIMHLLLTSHYALTQQLQTEIRCLLFQKPNKSDCWEALLLQPVFKFPQQLYLFLDVSDSLVSGETTVKQNSYIQCHRC